MIVLAVLLAWMIFLAILAVRVIRANPEHSAPEPLHRVGDLAEPPALVEAGWATRGFAPIGQYVVGPEETSAYISAWLSEDSTVFALLCEARDTLGIESRFRWIELISVSSSGEFVRISTLHDLPGHSHCGGREARRLHRAGPDATIAAHRAKVARQLGSPQRLAPDQLPEVSRLSAVAAHPAHSGGQRSWGSSWEMFRLFVMPWAVRRNLRRTLLLAAVLAVTVSWAMTRPSWLLMLLGGLGVGVVVGSFATRPASAWVLPLGVALISVHPERYGWPLAAAWVAAGAMMQLRIRRSRSIPFPERQAEAEPGLAPA